MTIDNAINYHVADLGVDRIGNIPTSVSSITFDCKGYLYGLTGDDLSEEDSEIYTAASVYRINKQTADIEFTGITRPCLGLLDYDQEFSFNWDDGLFYRIWSTSSVALFESFPLENNGFPTTYINVSDPYNIIDGDIDGMEYVGDGIFYIEVGSGKMAKIDIYGVVTDFKTEIDFQETVAGMLQQSANDYCFAL